ncbi:acyl-CoA dehydrogenase family protein [Mycolicibacterium confluentis]|uniref:Putative acyl-CoA dehydrogenase n=1 Tax=Mycolicibacterium confluentis TaxID=28047 RepID=A0A7I7Y4X7_9MYCO|nr:acyl-CoA dehydrogenase family protein [Mycolicibacterium confluentis]MCV7319114.1 acyl-CoA dehydrogenase family protein [Mycolicibacterium confluentis]ORV24835.1 acyl-CoA dehydrogenase [Mycolicibacterium confluentis]BBZ36727.1 putative acyl-CoA dehydrogenase [Mycolicibacterium confluentis]
MIDFEIPAETAALRDQIRAFVNDKIVPYETDPRLTRHGPTEEMRTEMVELAREAGLLTFQAPARFGGREPSHVDQAVLFEAAGWSTLGPVALNCAAPDEGNMFLLGKIANEQQVEEFLVPVIEGRQRSVFAMTEPDGAGSDPNQLKTEAVFDGSDYVINGRKWLITGANGARTWIIMARVAPNEHGPDGPTLFLCDGDTPGIEIERVMNTMDRNYVEGHGVVVFNDLRLPASAVLGEVGQALRYAQLRLAPARLTHCMRWLGAASRAQAIAIEHARTRTGFGKPLAEHQGVGFMIADNEIALQQCRLAIWWACWTLDSGAKGRHESSMVKAMVSEELFKVADRCVQILGGMGISDETPVAMIFSDMRAFRLYDGPTEVHKYAISRQVLRNPR